MVLMKSEVMPTMIQMIQHAFQHVLVTLIAQMKSCSTRQPYFEDFKMSGTFLITMICVITTQNKEMEDIVTFAWCEAFPIE